MLHLINCHGRRIPRLAEPLLFLQIKVPHRLTCILMSIYNICFHGAIRKIPTFLVGIKLPSGAVEI